jgi:hypothetical protein
MPPALSLRANPDLPRPGRAAELLDAVRVHGRAAAPGPQIAAARRERVRPFDPDIARVEREGIAAFDAVPLGGLQEELRHRGIAVVGIEYIDALGPSPAPSYILLAARSVQSGIVSHAKFV